MTPQDVLGEVKAYRRKRDAMRKALMNLEHGTPDFEKLQAEIEELELENDARLDSHFATLRNISKHI